MERNPVGPEDLRPARAQTPGHGEREAKPRRRIEHGKGAPWEPPRKRVRVSRAEVSRSLAALVPAMAHDNPDEIGSSSLTPPFAGPQRHGLRLRYGGDGQEGEWRSMQENWTR